MTNAIIKIIFNILNAESCPLHATFMCCETQCLKSTFYVVDFLVKLHVENQSHIFSVCFYSVQHFVHLLHNVGEMWDYCLKIFFCNVNWINSNSVFILINWLTDPLHNMSHTVRGFRRYVFQMLTVENLINIRLLSKPTVKIMFRGQWHLMIFISNFYKILFENDHLWQKHTWWTWGKDFSNGILLGLQVITQIHIQLNCVSSAIKNVSWGPYPCQNFPKIMQKGYQCPPKPHFI